MWDVKVVHISATNYVNAAKKKLKRTEQTQRMAVVYPCIKTSLNLKRVTSVEHGKW